MLRGLARSVLSLVVVSVGVMQPLIDPFFEAYHTLKTFSDDPSIEVPYVKYFTI